MSYAPPISPAGSKSPSPIWRLSLKFYAEVFQMDLSIDTSGPNPMVVFPTADATARASRGISIPARRRKTGRPSILWFPTRWMRRARA
jgi:predicted enzyme related to lactoylglutathione lyase